MITLDRQAESSISLFCLLRKVSGVTRSLGQLDEFEKKAQCMPSGKTSPYSSHFVLQRVRHRFCNAVLLLVALPWLFALFFSLSLIPAENRKYVVLVLAALLIRHKLLRIDITNDMFNLCSA